MYIVFMVAEKPSLAKSIAHTLAHGKETTRKGSNGACAIHEWVSDRVFRGVPANSVQFRMTSVCGHVMTLDFADSLNNWERVDPMELFWGPVYKKEANLKLKMVEFLRREARAANHVVLWLDCDREGENICFEVLDAIRGSIAQHAVIERAHFSAITGEAIHAAFRADRLTEPNKNEALAVDARQELDLRIGCAFTRFQTKLFQGRYADLDSRLVSFGPCQTPTLGFCVERQNHIQTFRPEPFWSVQTALRIPTGSGGGAAAASAGKVDRFLPLSWDRQRVFDHSVAKHFLEEVRREAKREGGGARLLRKTTREAVQRRPKPLNTVEMLKIASSRLNIGPSSCMQIAERLYTQGYISYPRTETSTYPAGFEIRSILQCHHENPHADALVRAATRDMFEGGGGAPRIGQARRGHDAGDHPPITPTQQTNPDVSGDAKRLYDYILHHFVATVMPDARFEIVQLSFAVSGSVGDYEERFSARSRRPIDPGFLKVMTSYWSAGGNDGDDDDAEEDNDEDDNDNVAGLFNGGLDDDGSALLSDLNIEWLEGAVYPLCVQRTQLEESHTRPPPLLSEAELIKKMEAHGIGTDASIPVHIANIVERNYVRLITGQGRRLEPTTLGRVLVQGYKSIDRQLVQPHMRSQMEQQLVLIARGQAEFQSVLEHALVCYAAKFRYFVLKIGAMDQLFEANFSSIVEAGKNLSRCGKCRRYLKLIESRPQRLHCTSCNETFPLPDGGTLRLYKELRCPLDNYELVLWNSGGGKTAARTLIICPYCYAHPPFEDMPVRSACDTCLHPSCAQAPAVRRVCDCFECAAASAAALVGVGGGDFPAAATNQNALPTQPVGVLLLDDSSAPRYRLQCNRCSLIITIASGGAGGGGDSLKIRTMSLAEPRAVCEQCSSALFLVKLRRSEADAEDFLGCIFCDENISKLLDIPQQKLQNHRRGRGGGARGGRGGGRGSSSRGGGRGGRPGNSASRGGGGRGAGRSGRSGGRN